MTTEAEESPPGTSRWTEQARPAAAACGQMPWRDTAPSEPSGMRVRSPPSISSSAGGFGPDHWIRSCQPSRGASTTPAARSCGSRAAQAARRRTARRRTAFFKGIPIPWPYCPAYRTGLPHSSSGANTGCPPRCSHPARQGIAVLGCCSRPPRQVPSSYARRSTRTRG